MFKNSRCRAIAVTVIAAGLTVSFASHPLAGPGRDASIRNVVLVHGAWADGSSWARVIPLLQARGFNVVAAQLPLTSLADDTAAVKRAIDRMTSEHPGPVVLVGHSYGGAVIGEASTDRRVAALVYVAAFAPDQGDSPWGCYPPIQRRRHSESIFPSTRLGFSRLTRLASKTTSHSAFLRTNARSWRRRKARHESRLLPPRPSPLRGKQNLAGTSFQVTQSIDSPGLEESMAVYGQVRLRTCHVAMLDVPFKVTDAILDAAAAD